MIFMKMPNFKIDVGNISFIVLGIVILFTLIIIISLLFDQLSIEPSIINCSIVMVLLFVTLLYTNYTAQIVDETKKDRNVAFIERRLENLYFPLKFCLKHHSKITLSTFNYKDIISIRKYLDNIIPYLYLSSNSLRDNLELFLKIIEIDLTKILEELKKAMDDNRVESKKLNNIAFENLETPNDLIEYFKKSNQNAKNFFDLIDEIQKINNTNSNPDDIILETIEKNKSDLISLYSKILRNIDEDISEYESNLKELLR